MFFMSHIILVIVSVGPEKILLFLISLLLSVVVVVALNVSYTIKFKVNNAKRPAVPQILANFSLSLILYLTCLVLL